MSQSSAASSSGIGLGSLLFVLFVGLKLTHVIAWSWWWIAAPLWIPFSVVVVLVTFAAVCAALAAHLERKPARRF